MLLLFRPLLYWAPQKFYCGTLYNAVQGGSNCECVDESLNCDNLNESKQYLPTILDKILLRGTNQIKAFERSGGAVSCSIAFTQNKSYVCFVLFFIYVN